MTTLAKNVLIGIFVIIAFAIVVFMLLFLHPTVGDEGRTLHVRFTDIDKVNIGTRVTYAGKPVGEVIEIKEIPDARSHRLDQKGDVYVYELVLRVDSGVNVFNTDEISVRTSGLLGEKNIAINPQPLKPGEKLYLLNDTVIYADQTGSVEDTLKSFNELSKKFEKVLDGLSDTIEKIKEEKIVEKIARSAQNIQDITDSLNQPDKWRETIDNVVALSRKANNSWNDVDETIQGFKNTSHNAQEFTSGINKIVLQTNRGEGTVGKLFMSDELYLRLKSLFHRGETVMSDMNTYGLLYHNNKKWQRLNAYRMNLLNRLSTPQKFSGYFGQELDRLSTSLSRVNMSMDNSCCYPNDLWNNPEFMSRFSELIRQVEDMEESLKMYNEQIADLTR